MAATGRSCLECGHETTVCYTMPMLTMVRLCTVCPVTGMGCVIFMVRGMRVALSGEQLRNPSIFLEVAATRPMVLQHATEDLCIQMAGYRLTGGNEEVQMDIPPWRTPNRRGYVHARTVISIATLSLGDHRFNLFIPEPTVTSIAVRYYSMEHLLSGLMDRVEEVFGQEARAAAETIQSGRSSSLTIPMCSLATGTYANDGIQVGSITCMTRMLCMVTGGGLFTLSTKVLAEIHAAIKRARTRSKMRILDCTNHGRYIGVCSDTGPIVNVTSNGVMLYMSAPTQYVAVMSELLGTIADLFTSGRGPSVAAHMSRVVKYRWVLRLKETA